MRFCLSLSDRVSAAKTVLALLKATFQETRKKTFQQILSTASLSKSKKVEGLKTGALELSW